MTRRLRSTAAPRSISSPIGHPFEDFSVLRDDLRAIVERDVDLVVKRAIRNPYFREVALSQAETVYVANV